MTTIMWARTAAGTNLPFMKGLGKLYQTFREAFQTALKGKHLPNKQTGKAWDVSLRDTREKCYIDFQTRNVWRPGKSLQSQFFRSVFSRTTARSMASVLRRQAAVRLSSGPARNFRNIPLMSLIGVSLGANSSLFMDEGNERMMTEMRKTFQEYKWSTEPLERIPTCLDDLLINETSIGNGCEGAVYKARVKTQTDHNELATKTQTNLTSGLKEDDRSTSTYGTDSVQDSDFNLAVKAVFNYEAESNAYSIVRALEREIVPLRQTEMGNQLDAMLSKQAGRLPWHPNIVDMPCMFVDRTLVTEHALNKFPAAMPQSYNPECCFGRNKTLYLVMKRRSCHLGEFLTRQPPVAMTTRCQILVQLLEGVAHLERHGVAHRDLKADNILVDSPVEEGYPRVEICDFGCCLCEDDRSLKVAFPSRDLYLGGNARLMAPEIITTEPGPSCYLDYSRADLWAVGAIAYQVLGGENPFYPGGSHSTTQLSSRNYMEEDLPPLPEDVPGPIKKLVYSLLSRDPAKRPNPSVASSVVHMLLLAQTADVADVDDVADIADVDPRVQVGGDRVRDEDGTFQTRRQMSRPEARGIQKRSQRRSHPRYTCRDPGPYTSPFRSPHTGQMYRSNFVLGSAKEKAWLSFIAQQGGLLLCQLTFGDRSRPSDMETVMRSLYLSRLTYATFKKAVNFF